MTAREIIERRLGRKLPATASLAPDQRRAVKNLAVVLLKQAADRLHETPLERLMRRSGGSNRDE